ncbi:MAG: hypothetical protein ABSD51_14045 [Candidatus Binatus sp.]
MKSKRSLMTVLVGLAMLAAPVTAAAYENNNYAHNNSRPAHVSRSYNAPNAPARNLRPADVTRRDFRNNAAAANRDWREDHNAWNRGLGTAGEYRNYGNPGYSRAPGYPVVAPYYGARGYAGAGGCSQAQSVMNVYSRDRATGHPARWRACVQQLRRLRPALRLNLDARAAASAIRPVKKKTAHLTHS